MRPQPEDRRPGPSSRSPASRRGADGLPRRLASHRVLRALPGLSRRQRCAGLSPSTTLTKPQGVYRWTMRLRLNLRAWSATVGLWQCGVAIVAGACAAAATPDTRPGGRDASGHLRCSRVERRWPEPRRRRPADPRARDRELLRGPAHSDRRATRLRHEPAQRPQRRPARLRGEPVGRGHGRRREARHRQRPRLRRLHAASARCLAEREPGGDRRAAAPRARQRRQRPRLVRPGHHAQGRRGSRSCAGRGSSRPTPPTSPPGSRRTLRPSPRSMRRSPS